MTEFEEQIRTVLTRSVPMPPSTDQWGSVVRGRVKVRRRIQVAGGAVITVAVLAAALIIPTLFTGGSPQPAPAPAPPALGPDPLGLSNGCPAVTTPLRFPDHATLPDHPVAVRLCNGDDDSCFCGPDDQRIDTGFQEPVDLLTTGTQDLVDLVNNAKGAPGGDVMCAGVGGSTHVYWFVYADGETRAVSYMSGACLDLTVGQDELRYGGKELHEAFSDHLIAQRESMTAPDETRIPDCNPNVPPYSGLAFRSVELVTAVYCPLDDKGRWQRGVLSHEDVTALNRDYAVEDVTLPRSCPDAPRTSKIVGYTAWGDLIELTGDCNVFFGPDSYYNEGIIRAWKPSDTFLDALGELQLGSPEPQQAYPSASEN